MNEFISQAQDVGFDITTVLSGLAIFLFGIKTMGDSLKVVAGSRMKAIIDKSTNTPVKGVFVGALVTGLLQSSSGTTALAISLVRAGLMNLRQAVGIIMGANIGTTITAILIGFKISKYSPYILIVGAILLMFTRKTKSHNISLLIFSFGALFFGLDLMGSGLKVLADMPLFKEFAVSLAHNKILGLLLGSAMTILIQSSSATIGILQSLYSDGLISLEGALPILFGDNIGTTITAVLASIGGSVASRRAAAAHVTFNVTGTIIFIIIFPLFYSLVVKAADIFDLNPAMQIAFAHATFNVSTTVLLLPFIGVIVWFVTKLIKDEADDENLERITLDEKLLEISPKDAVTAAYANAIEMVNLCKKMSIRTKKYIFNRDFKSRDKVVIYEEVLNDYNKNISNYLIKIGEAELDEFYTGLQTALIYSTKDLERIGDHFTNLINHFDELFNVKESLTPYAKDEVDKIFEKIDILIDKLAILLETYDEEIVNEIISLEDQVDILNDEAKDGFVHRYKKGMLSGEISATLYIDILSDLERIGDHCENIALRVKKAHN
ncbi:MAG: Na/Pi cotransporter family protein [Bacilli bacterium]